MSLSRRGFLIGGVAAGAVVLAGGVGLVETEVLPGRTRLNTLLGACGSPTPVPDVTPGPVSYHTYRSAARGSIDVGWSVAYPPGTGPGSVLPVCITLPGRGGDHRSAFESMKLHYYLADVVNRGATPPYALASFEGGEAVNWHARANGDDPQRAVVEELLPRLAANGLIVTKIGLHGVSLGGYGALLLAARLGSARTAAVAVSSPAIWETYAQAQPGTFDGPEDFARNDLFDLTSRFAGIPVEIDCGSNDPFAGGVQRFRAQLRPTPAGGIEPGCHDDAFFSRVAERQLIFIGRYLPTR